MGIRVYCIASRLQRRLHVPCLRRARLTTSAVASVDSIGRRADALAGWEFQLRWKKNPKPPLPQSLALATGTSIVGRRIKKPPWGWLFSTATNSVR